MEQVAPTSQVDLAALRRLWFPWAMTYLGLVFASSVTAQLGYETLATVLKPLPLLLLLVEVGRPLLQGERSRLRVGVWWALLFSVIGDMVIIWNFLGGIGAFFLAHLAYLVAVGFERTVSVRQALCYIPALILWGIMFQLLTPEVNPALYWPVVAYLSVICLMYGRMISRAFATHRHVWAVSMFVGATLFVLSDSLIAINKWVTPVPYERLAILLSYYIGQWFISRGVPPPEKDLELNR